MNPIVYFIAWAAVFGGITAMMLGYKENPKW
jgi:hypothetical protein